MVAFTFNLIAWIVCILFRFFVIGGICYGVYSLIKDKREWWLVGKHQREAEDREREEQWERVSKEIKESGFSLDARKKEMTPEEKAKIKKDKIIVIISFSILAILVLAGMIASLFD